MDKSKTKPKRSIDKRETIPYGNWWRTRRDRSNCQTIDPDILNIAPDLMKTAPAAFLSNMTETEINSIMYESNLLN